MAGVTFDSILPAFVNSRVNETVKAAVVTLNPANPPCVALTVPFEDFKAAASVQRVKTLLTEQLLGTKKSIESLNPQYVVNKALTTIYEAPEYKAPDKVARIAYVIMDNSVDQTTVPIDDCVRDSNKLDAHDLYETLMKYKVSLGIITLPSGRNDSFFPLIQAPPEATVFPTVEHRYLIGHDPAFTVQTNLFALHRYLTCSYEP